MTAAAKEAAAAGFVATGHERPSAGKKSACFGDAALRVGFDFAQGIHIGDAGLLPDRGRKRTLAADDDGFLLVFLAKGQDAPDEFPVKALAVEAALAGDDEVGGGDLFFEAGHLAEELPAGDQPGAELGEGGTYATRRAAAPAACVQMTAPRW